MLREGEPFQAEIAYSGQPVAVGSKYLPFVSHLGLFYEPEQDNAYVASTPDGACYWFPANDHPLYKATFRVELTIPQGLTGVSNGRLVDQQSDIRSVFTDTLGSRFVWEENKPEATYLVTAATGNYLPVEGVSAQGVPLRSYIFSESQPEFSKYAETIGTMLDWMSARFGPYPFKAFGYITVSGLRASLETQTMVLLDQTSIAETTMAHELSHMWFGDWVSLDSWGEIWRNEGFATYVVLLWQTRDNPQALDEIISSYEQNSKRMSVNYSLNDPPPASMFDSTIYTKGAVVVHKLRQKMGDVAFFKGCRPIFKSMAVKPPPRQNFRQLWRRQRVFRCRISSPLPRLLMEIHLTNLLIQFETGFFYLLTTACYEHQPHLNTSQRRQGLVDLLFEEFISQGIEILGWVVLTNNYHLLVHVTEFVALGGIFKRIHGRTSRNWNAEEGLRGRQIWYHYRDKAIRFERHYYATLNYIHYNPVKHGLVESAYDWQWSRLKLYYDCERREWLRELWKQYPIEDYGKDWDR